MRLEQVGARVSGAASSANQIGDTAVQYHIIDSQSGFGIAPPARTKLRSQRGYAHKNDLARACACVNARTGLSSRGCGAVPNACSVRQQLASARNI